nr:MAG TPA: hypothetical protein [Caudoviricetes sp.]
MVAFTTCPIARSLYSVDYRVNIFFTAGKFFLL